MSVKRVLKLDTGKKINPPDATPQKTRKKTLNSYSPTTGTCQLSPFSSPLAHNDPKNPREPPAEGLGREQSHSSAGSSRRGQPPTEQEGFLELQSQVKSSLARILKTRANLTSLQALEGSRELENILGASGCPGALSAELHKTQTLLTQAEELQLLKANHGELPARAQLCIHVQGRNVIVPLWEQRYVPSAGSATFLRWLLERDTEPLGLLPARPSTRALPQ